MSDPSTRSRPCTRAQKWAPSPCHWVHTIIIRSGRSTALFSVLSSCFKMAFDRAKWSSNAHSSLRSKHFQSSYCAKVTAEAKKKGWFLLSPLPPPSFIFFCSCPSFLDEPREETLATQAMYTVTYRVLKVWTQHHFVPVPRYRFPSSKCGQPLRLKAHSKRHNQPTERVISKMK